MVFNLNLTYMLQLSFYAVIFPFTSSDHIGYLTQKNFPNCSTYIHARNSMDYNIIVVFPIVENNSKTI